tara:strand:- start:8922 stop:9422 length:501 start_codon:yes stop_codon:yes gene_type:complete
MTGTFMPIITEIDDFGNVNVRTTASETAKPHRRVIAPGAVIGGSWVPTDVSAEPQEVKDAVAEAWTPAVVSSYRSMALQSYAEAVPAPVTSIHKAYFRAALAAFDKLGDVDAAVTAAGPVKAELWAGATTIDITDPDVVAIAGALEIDVAAVLTKAREIQAGDRAA